jgi:dihydroneopterin aldolase
VDKIFLRGLRVEAVIGVWEWERRIRQIINIDLEMAADVRGAARTDSIDDALNYKEIAKHLIGVVQASEFRLVETLAETLARIIVVDFAVPWVRLALSKPGAIEGSQDVGVIVERSHDDYA